MLKFFFAVFIFWCSLAALSYGVLIAHESLLRLIIIALIALSGFSIISGIYFKKNILYFLSAVLFGSAAIASHFDFKQTIKEECDFFKTCSRFEYGFVCDGVKFTFSADNLEKKCIANEYWRESEKE